MKLTLTSVAAFFILMLCARSVDAQIKEINPSVQWNFVRSDSVQMVEGNAYIYNFPARKNFDYIITLQHGEFEKDIMIEVSDIQGSVVAQYNQSSSNGSSDLQFEVEHNATFQVRVRIGVSTPANPKNYQTLFSLLKREKT